MNQTAGYYLRVGIVLLAALGLALAGFGWLSGRLTQSRTIGFDVLFDDARGISPGSDVQMAGVRIGSVESVDLTPENQARLRLRVDRRRPIPAGSRFVIGSSLLGNTSVLRVEPAPAGGPVIAQDQPGLRGASGGGVESALAQSQQLLASVQKTADAFARLANDPATQRDLQASLRNVRLATEGLPVLTRQVQGLTGQAQSLTVRAETELAALSGQSRRLIANLEVASARGERIARNVEGISGDARATLNENRRGLRELVENAAETTSAIRGITENLGETFRGGRLQANLLTASDNLTVISARFDTIAANIERLSSDPRLSSDIQETVANLRETSASVRSLAARIEGIRLPGGGGRRGGNGGQGGPPPPTDPLSETGPVFDAVFDADRERLRLDGNFTLAGTEGRFYRVGLYDLTEANRLNLQLGQASGSFALRYGLVAGKIGGGVDRRLGPVDLRLDLFDPNRLTVNVRAKARLSPSTSALLGIESLGNGNRPTLGVQFRR